MYLNAENLAPALAFVRSPLWLDMKRCLMERRSPAPDAKDLPHTAAARGFERAAFERALVELEKLPFEQKPTDNDPFARPAVSDTRD